MNNKELKIASILFSAIFSWVFITFLLSINVSIHILMLILPLLFVYYLTNFCIISWSGDFKDQTKNNGNIWLKYIYVFFINIYIHFTYIKPMLIDKQYIELITLSLSINLMSYILMLPFTFVEFILNSFDKVKPTPKIDNEIQYIINNTTKHITYKNLSVEQLNDLLNNAIDNEDYEIAEMIRKEIESKSKSK